MRPREVLRPVVRRHHSAFYRDTWPSTRYVVPYPRHHISIGPSPTAVTMAQTATSLVRHKTHSQALVVHTSSLLTTQERTAMGDKLHKGLYR